MKKIVIAFVLALMSIFANGQIVRKDKNEYFEAIEFHLGDYVFEGPSYLKRTGEQTTYDYRVYLNSIEEASELYKLIMNNKREIEAKYNVFIEKVVFHYNTTFVEAYIYNSEEEYNAIKAAEIAKEKAIQDKMKEEMNKRLNSIL